MDSLTTVALVTLTSALAAKGAEAPAKTLNLLWQATLGRWNPKLESIVQKHIEKYAKDIDTEISKIPTESINPEPDISLIGPALEASKFYVAKEEAREMFSKLIAAELNIEKASQVHHSFVDIIKQMSSNDARLLKILPKTGPLCEIRLYPKEQNYYQLIGTADMIYLPGQIDNNFTNNAISINNLSRLGLVEIDHIRSLTDETYYEPYKSLQDYQQGLEKLRSLPEEDKDLRLDKGMFSLTPFGDLFRKICL